MRGGDEAGRGVHLLHEIIKVHPEYSFCSSLWVEFIFKPLLVLPGHMILS